jgi:DNA-binding beta-propeller fold protein YncE
MKISSAGAAILALTLQASPPPTPSDPPVAIALPGGSGGIGFDDLQFSARLGRVLAPGGRSGRLFLVDPKTFAVSFIDGFSPSGPYGGGHGEGITSVSEGEDRLFVTDRTARALLVVDPRSRKTTARASLAASPDYVRYVASTREVWVTEPDADQIEIFRLGSTVDAPPEHAALIPVQNGPESLVVDAARGRAYTHLWEATTLAIDLKTRAVAARWKNLCEGSRGIAFDEARGLLFAGCSEGRAVVLDAGHDGKIVGDVKTEASGVDIIDYDRSLRHLYLPGAKSANTVFLAVGEDGSLTKLGTVPSPAGAHCVVSDQAGRAYVCDPRAGRLLAIPDRFAASPRR